MRGGNFILPVLISIPLLAIPLKSNAQLEDIAQSEQMESSEDDITASKRVYEQAAEYGGNIYKVRINEDNGKFSLLGTTPSAPDSIKNKLLNIASFERKADIILADFCREYRRKHLKEYKEMVVEMACQLASEGFPDYFKEKYGSAIQRANSNEPNLGDVAQSIDDFKKSMDLANGNASWDDALERLLINQGHSDEVERKEISAKRSREDLMDLETQVRVSMYEKILESMEIGYNKGGKEMKYFGIPCEFPKVAVSPLMQEAIRAYRDLKSAMEKGAVCSYFEYDYSKPATVESAKERVRRYSANIVMEQHSLDFYRHALEEYSWADLRYYKDRKGQVIVINIGNLKNKKEYVYCTKSLGDAFKNYSKNVNPYGRLIISPADKKNLYPCIDAVWEWIAEEPEYGKFMNPDAGLVAAAKEKYFSGLLKSLE